MRAIWIAVLGAVLTTGLVACSSTPTDEQAPAAVEDRANAFDLAWAREVVQRAIAQMRSQCEQSAERSGKQRLWRVFHSVALQPLLGGVEPPTHEQLVKQLGFDSPQQVSNTLVTAKRMFARVVREVVGEYATDNDEIELELHDLFNVLSRAGATADRRVSGRDPH